MNEKIKNLLFVRCSGKTDKKTKTSEEKEGKQKCAPRRKDYFAIFILLAKFVHKPVYVFVCVRVRMFSLSESIRMLPVAY